MHFPATGTWDARRHSFISFRVFERRGPSVAAASGDSLEMSFLWQSISIFTQRFNAILIGETFSYLEEAFNL